MAANPSLQPTCCGLRPPHAAKLKRYSSFRDERDISRPLGSLGRVLFVAVIDAWMAFFGAMNAAPKSRGRWFEVDDDDV
jgi:hypothetical protein